MRPPAWLRTAGALMGLQAVLGALTYFAFDYPLVAPAGGAVFLYATWHVAAELRSAPRSAAVAAALLAQLPGLPGSVNVLLVQLRLYPQNSLGDLLDFVMQTWHTVLLPWVQLLPGGLLPTPSGELLSRFFMALPLLSPLLVGWVLYAARQRRPLPG